MGVLFIQPCSYSPTLLLQVLEAGQLVERGSHSSLLELGGKYAELWRIQNQGKKEEEEVVEEMN